MISEKHYGEVFAAFVTEKFVRKEPLRTTHAFFKVLNNALLYKEH